MQQTIKRTLLTLAATLLVAFALQSAQRHVAASVTDTVPAASRTKQAVPTFNKEVVRIFQNSCQTCHHPGDIAPFSLMTYKDARPWAVAIREQVVLKKMPPWKPVPGCGDLRDARGLTEQEIATLVAWVDGGAPEGNAADLPTPREFTGGWSEGAPDLVVASNESYTPPVQGDIYRCFSVPVGDLRGDRYLSGLSVRPGNAKIVHHVIVYPDPTGASVALDQKDPGPGYTCFGGPGFGTTDFLGGWAPGSRGYFAPEGTGIKLTNNARAVIQVHYHPTGEQETDLTQVGLYFAKTPVTRQFQVLPLVNQSFAIPPGAKSYDVTASFSIPSLISAKLWGVTPHMHLLGKKIKVEMTRPGASAADCLIRIDDWDFNWQGSYLYKNPIPLTGGATLKMTATYDNSVDNPRQPNHPPKTVRWGEETTDEMALAFIGFTVDALALPVSAPTLSDVMIDAQGALLVSGAGFLAGADIEINGRSLRDTLAPQQQRLSSADLWKVYAAPGQEVSVTVINPDGARTPALKFTRPGTARTLATVSAASFSADAVAPEAIVAAFGTGLATTTMAASASPLPTELAGTKVRVNGVLAPLFFVAAQQVNFLIPAGTQTGSAVVEITSGDQIISRGTVNVSAAAPSIFTANAQGTGAPAAVATKNGQTYFGVGNADGSSNPLDVGDYLVLFGTGLRYASAASVSITIGGQPVPALYAGAQGQLTGLDQINVQIPPGVSGLTDVVISAGGKTANVVKVRVR